MSIVAGEEDAWRSVYGFPPLPYYVGICRVKEYRTRRVRRLVRASHHTAQVQLVRNTLSRFPFLDRDSVANVQGLASIPTVRLERKLGRLPRDVSRLHLRAALYGFRAHSGSPTMTLCQLR